MNFSKFFVNRPRFAAVLSIVIFIAGLVALPRLPISEYPEVVPPTVVVRAAYPGANPAVIGQTVAAPLEQAINGVEGMIYQSSQSASDGAMILTVTFALGTDHRQGLARPDPGRAHDLAQQPLRHAVPQQLRAAECP
jgi:multidrug efflux pump